VQLIVSLACCARLLAGVASAADVTPEDAQTLVAAQKAYDTAKYAEAVRLLLPMRAKDPDHGDIPRMLTHAHFELGQFEKARDTALAAIGTGRLSPDVLGRIAQIDQRRDDRLALINVVRLLTVLDPGNHRWRMVYADLLAGSEALDESAGVYRALLAEQPDSADIALRLGNVLLKQKRFEDAAATLETAWHLGAADARLPTTIAGAWQQLGDDRQALAWLERAAALEQSANPQRQLQIGHLLWKLGEHDRSVAAVSDLSSSEDNAIKSQAHVLLGRIAVDRKQVEKAISHWQQAAAAGETGPELLSVLGAHYYNSGDFKTAAKVLRRVVDQEQAEDEQRLRFLILSFIRSGDPATARTYLRQYIEQHGLSEEAKALIRSLATAKPAEAKNSDTKNTDAKPTAAKPAPKSAAVKSAKPKSKET
jgi:tetratricopeptide (TPR) repeat protein